MTVTVKQYVHEGGIKPYFEQQIQDTEIKVQTTAENLRRLEAQRNKLNNKVRKLKDELRLLQEPGSYVGEVVKVMGLNKVLVKIHPEGKYIVNISKDIDIKKLTPSLRVCLKADSYDLHKILPNKIDPLVSLMMVEKVPDSTYDMVGGLDKQIKEIKEVIELPVKHPELFESLGIAQPKGVILYGPPGTGKTLLARSVAHHTECKFIRVSGSELVQKYIGEGSRMVRELFVMAREHAPSIIFMDEIDSIGSSRVEGSSGGDSEVQRTMLELLNQLDGFESSKDIKIIMATNRLDILDPALLRPGRIDRKIEFPAPTVNARTDILKIHSRSMNLTRGINLRKIADKMNGCSGADVKGVCTEAGMYALRERRIHVTQEDFELAVAKVMSKNDEVCLGDFVAESQRVQQLLLTDGPTVNVLNEFSDLILQYEKAEEHINLSQLYFKKSLIEINLGKEKDAIADLKTCLEFDPSLKPAKLKLADLLVEHSMFEDPGLIDVDDATQGKIDKFKDDFVHMIELCDGAGTETAKLQECNEIIENDLIPISPYNTTMYRYYIKNLQTLLPNHPEDSRKIIHAYTKLMKSSKSNLENYVQLSNFLLYTQVKFEKAFTNVKQCLRIDNEYKECGALSKLYSKFKKFFDLLETYSDELSHIYLSAEGDNPTIEPFDMKNKIDFQYVIDFLGEKPTKRQLAGLSNVNNNHDYLLHFIDEFHQSQNLQTSKLVEDLNKMVCEGFVQVGDVKNTKVYCGKVQGDFLPKSIPEIDAFIAKKRFPQAEALLKKFPVNARQTELFRSRWGKVEEHIRYQQHQQQQQRAYQQQQHQQQQRQRQQAPQSPKNDYYKVLDVPRDADDKTVKKGHRTQTLKYHPDKYKGTELSADQIESKMQEINQAYEVLSSPELRERYDRGDDPNDPMAGQGGQRQGSPFRSSQFGGNGGGFQFNFGSGGAGFNFGGFGGNQKVKFKKNFKKRRH